MPSCNQQPVTVKSFGKGYPIMSVKIDIISGFVGSGKTTLINKLMEGFDSSEKVAIVENEFGEIGIDGSLLAQSGVTVTEISGGCICCSLFGNFVLATGQLIEEYRPDRILIEPTGLGKLSDVMKALGAVAEDNDIKINVLVTVVDPLRFEFSNTMFGEFFQDQIAETNTIVLSRTQMTEPKLLEEVVASLREMNPLSQIISLSWEDASGKELLDSFEASCGMYDNSNVQDDESCPVCGGHHEHCDCGDSPLEHHHSDHQKAAEISSVSISDVPKMSPEHFRKIFSSLSDTGEYGLLIRSKGYFYTSSEECYRFDYVHGELQIISENMRYAERMVLIGKNLKEDRIRNLFL